MPCAAHKYIGALRYTHAHHGSCDLGVVGHGWAYKRLPERLSAYASIDAPKKVDGMEAAGLWEATASLDVAS